MTKPSSTAAPAIAKAQLKALAGALAVALALASAGLLAGTPWNSAQAQGGKPPPKGIQGLVVAVTDGDTLTLRPATGKPITVRLAQIDAPEICQAWGPEARQALAELALDKIATLQPRARDSYGRTVGRLRIDELDVGRHLVENGHAWSTRTRYDRGPMVKQERMAKALSRGLHSQPGAVAPWEFRQRNGRCPPAPGAGDKPGG